MDIPAPFFHEIADSVFHARKPYSQQMR
jgi:hypothetical protein